MCNGWLTGLLKRLRKGLLRVCSGVGLRAQRADANGWLNGLAQRLDSRISRMAQEFVEWLVQRLVEGLAHKWIHMVVSRVGSMVSLKVFVKGLFRG